MLLILLNAVPTGRQKPCQTMLQVKGPGQNVAAVKTSHRLKLDIVQACKI